jgi:hypothetical protein
LVNDEKGMQVIPLLIIDLIGPLAQLNGADSRVYREDDRRGWWPGAPR